MQQQIVYLLIMIGVILCSKCSATDISTIVSRSAFDEDLYEKVLDEELCDEHLQFISTENRLLRLQFIDAGYRLPRGILQFNLADWGNYHQCLAINHPIANSIIEGKYCAIAVPLEQNLLQFTGMTETIHWSEILDEDAQRKLMEYAEIRHELLKLPEMRNNSLRVAPGSPVAALTLTLAICIPKVCTTQQVIDFILSPLNMDYSDLFCRIPNDKPFSAADFVAITLFSLIGLLMILSTAYDLHQTFILKKTVSEISKLGSSFSVYTNTKRLVTYTSSPDSLECIDGIRALSVIWIIIGHTLSTSLTNLGNPIDALEWIRNFRSVWVLASPIAVDTFLMMSGLLLVYTVTAKFNRSLFLRNLHYFYILRYLRIFPLLATVVLLQASLFNHMSDGPMWWTVGTQVESCRTYWWSALLHVQNYVNPTVPCIGILWYISVDMQLHWISPLLLVWVLSDNRSVAWGALDAGFLISLTIGTVISFLSNLPATAVSLGRFDELDLYMTRYYVNTLTRASPFFVGMLYGYLLHQWRGKKAKFSQILVFVFWMFTILSLSFVFLIAQPIGRDDYDNQMLDNFLNAFMRPLWAAALGWLIFACTHGFAGPANWFLSLRMWKLPARLSYAMYVIHYPLMAIFQGSLVSPLFFSVGGLIYRYIADLTITVLVSFILTLAVDLPLSTLQKIKIGDGPKLSSRRDAKNDATNTNSNNE